MRLQFYNPYLIKRKRRKPTKTTCLLTDNKYAMLNLVDHIIGKFHHYDQLRETPHDDKVETESVWKNANRLIYQTGFRIILPFYQKLKEEFCWRIDDYENMEINERKLFERKIASLEQLCSLIIFSLKPRRERGSIKSPVSEWTMQRVKSVEITEEVRFIYFDED